MSDGVEGSSVEPIDRKIIENLILGAAPEIGEKLREFLDNYQTLFLLDKDSKGLLFVAGKRHVRFNHKTLRHDWLVGYAAWKALACYGPFICVGLRSGSALGSDQLIHDPQLPEQEASIQTLLYKAQQLRVADAAEDVPWPNTVPPPQASSVGMDIQDKAAFELVCIATAASFLHELSHIRFAQSPQDRPLSIDEEKSCDEYAREMMITDIGTHAASLGVAEADLLDKRSTGLAIAAFIIHQQTPPAAASGSDTHPSSAERFRHFLSSIELDDNSKCWVIAASLLIQILRQQNKHFSVQCITAKYIFWNLLNRLT